MAAAAAAAAVVVVVVVVVVVAVLVVVVVAAAAACEYECTVWNAPIRRISLTITPLLRCAARGAPQRAHCCSPSTPLDTPS
jgi:hypothetical protein